MERAAARGAGGVAPGMELGVEDNNLYCCVQLLLLSIMGCCVGVGVYVEPLFEMCCFHMGKFLQGGKNGRLMSYFF